MSRRKNKMKDGESLHESMERACNLIKECYTPTTPPCDHGYDTTLPDGSDPYKDKMNNVMRHVIILFSQIQGTNCDNVVANMGSSIVDIINNLDETMIRKIVATGLRLWTCLEPNCNQLNVLCTLVTHVERNGEGSITEQEQYGIGDLMYPANLLLFYVERAPCSCFDHVKAKLKDTPTGHFCQHRGCFKIIKGLDVFECENCSITYCSVSCQERDWPRHRFKCKLFTSAKVKLVNSPPNCKHGYDTMQADGCDPYEERMAAILQQVRLFNIEEWETIGRSRARNILLPCLSDGPTFLQKLTAKGLNMLFTLIGEEEEEKLIVTQTLPIGLILILLEQAMEIPPAADEASISNSIGLNGFECLSLFLIHRAPCSCFEAKKKELVRKTQTSFHCLNKLCTTALHSTNFFTCNGCDVAVDCSADCQRADWYAHKVFCNVNKLRARPKGKKSRR